MYGQSELKDPICYHLLTLRIIEELMKRPKSDLTVWLQADGNVLDVALANTSDCCGDTLIDNARISIRSEIVSGELQNLGIYEATLRLLCCLLTQISADDFGAIEMTLLKHLLGGKFWGSLLSCDIWSSLGRFVMD